MLLQGFFHGYKNAQRYVVSMLYPKKAPKSHDLIGQCSTPHTTVHFYSDILLDISVGDASILHQPGSRFIYRFSIIINYRNAQYY